MDKFCNNAVVDEPNTTSEALEALIASAHIFCDL